MDSAAEVTVTVTVEPNDSGARVEAAVARSIPPDELAQELAPADYPLRAMRTIDSASAKPATPFQAFDTLSLNLADLRGDGRLEVITLNDNHRAYVIDPVRGAILAELQTDHPGGDSWGARDINGIAVGDVTGDGHPDLAVLNSAATLTVLTLDEAASSRSEFVYTPAWSQVVTATKADPDFYATHPWFKTGSLELGADGNPFIAHVRGEAVVLAQSDGYPAHMAFGPTGDLRWFTDYWDGNSGPWAGALKTNGPEMAVFATDAGHVVAYDVGSGKIQWDFSAPDHGANPGSISIMPTVVDLHGDGTKSIFVGARVAVDDKSEDWMLRQHARYFLLDSSGNVLWSTSYPWGNPGSYVQPATVDLDGDGVKDIITLDWNTIGHKPGNWEKLGPANLIAINGANGKALWHRLVDAQWSNTGLAMADFFPGQPGPQIMTEEQLGLRDGLSFFGPDGSRLGWMPLPDSHMTVRRGPVLADIDGDGFAEAILPVSSGATGCPQHLDVGCRAGSLLVYSTQARDDSVVFDNNDLFDSMQDSGLAIASG